MTSINDLLSNLTQQNPISPRDRPETWRLHFVVSSAARLWRDEAPLLRGLIHEGFVVHVIAHDDGAFEAMQRSGVRTCAIPSCDELTRALMLSPILFPILVGHFVDHPPTLIHVEHEPLLSLVSLAVSQLDERPLMVGTLRGAPAPTARLRDMLPELVAAPLHRLDELYWARQGATLDAFLTTSRAELQHLIDHTPIAARMLEVWASGSGYDHTHFDPARHDLPSRAELRGMANVPDSWRFTIGVAGDFESDAARLAQTILALARVRPDVGWLLARVPGATTPAALKALDEHIIWLEPGEHGMPLFVSACDVFYSPRCDGRQATTLLEAQAMGTPVVAFATRDHDAIVLDAQTGHLVPLDESTRSRHQARHTGQRAAQCIAELLDDPDQLKVMGEQAKTRAINKFTRAASHDQLMRLYDRLLSRRYASQG